MEKRRLSAKLPADLWVELERLSAEKGITISDLVRRILVKDLIEGKIKIRREKKW